MPKRVRKYEEALQEAPKDPKEVVTYLNAHLEDDGGNDSEELFLMALREETADLRVGIGRIRWADSEAEVKQQYPENRPGTAYEGTDPHTGERVSVGPGVVIPTFDVIGDLIRLSAFVDFDPDGVTTIDLQAEPASEVSDPDRWPEVVADAAAKLGERLGFGPVDGELMEQDWDVNGVSVSLELESSGFQLTIEPRS